MRKPGYRSVLRTYALAEASIGLTAVLPDDMFAATQRNIAALYEYWCCLALRAAVSSICDSEPNGALFRPTGDGLSLVLVQGEASRTSWRPEIAGRQMEVVLWFNRTFRPTRSPHSSAASSWSNTLRPDISMRIRPRSARPSGAVDPNLDVWLHFDAKYRLDRGAAVAEEDPVANAKATDVLRMHAYRDAIRRSAGAYVLFPGDGSPDRWPEFDELIPGIGAFPLRPTADGAHGVDALEVFLQDVLTHAANQASASERAQYWLSHHTAGAGPNVVPSEALVHPPADESVLVGYVRSDQLRWIRDTRSYNLRADGRRGSVTPNDDMLKARLILLWTGPLKDPAFVGLFERTDGWVVRTSSDLRATGYPDRSGEGAYLVTQIDAAHSRAEAVVGEAGWWRIERSSVGAPTATSWDRLARLSVT